MDLRWIFNQLQSFGVKEEVAEYLNALILLALSMLLIYITHNVVRRILRISLIRLVLTYKIEFFRYLIDNKFPHYLALAAPLFLAKIGIPIVFADFPTLIRPLDAFTEVYMILVILWVIISVINAFGDDFKKKPNFREKPIDSYVQVIRIILFLIAAVIVFSNLTGKSPVAFFTAMGALSAILLLMFKDTIMGFVASIQVTSNDMVRIGDWITMSKYGADGEVLQINLTTVKVQNFDKTITTIPTYALISDSFQNWRGMQTSGGRRIKRAIFIKQSSIRFIKPEEIESFRKIQSLTQYIDHRQKDIDKNNERIQADKSLLINGRNLTNAGLFRKYIDNYLASNTGTNKKMTMMTRQLAPTTQGLPIEIYAFTNTVKWIEYEHIMADIFDHLLASAVFFDLEIYELDLQSELKN